MRHSRFLSTLLLAVAATVSPCRGQDEGGVTLQFVSFPRVADTEPVELLTGKGKTIEVRIPANELSPPYKVKRRDTWAIGKSEEGTDGQAKFTAYGRAKALASSKQLLLLIRKGRTNADGFRIIPLDNRANQFGGGQFLFLNAARIDIAGEVGKRKFALKPGKHTILKPKADLGENLCHATFLYRKEDSWKSFFSSNWPLQNDARGFIFFYNEPRSSRLKLHTIRDFP